MKPCRLVSVLAATALAALLWIRPQSGSSIPVEVSLANRTVVIGEFPREPLQSPSDRGTLPYVLATTSRVDQASRQAAESAGVRVIGPLTGKTFLVEATPKAIASLAADSRFAGAVEFLPSDKVDGKLSALLEQGAREVIAAIVAIDPVDRERLRQFVQANDGEELEGCLNGKDSFRAKLPAELVGKLAKRGDVRWIEQFRRPRLLNDYAVEPAAMNVREAWNAHGLSGTNQIVSTSDSGIDTGDLSTMHRDLANRICGFAQAKSYCDSTDKSGHGTHTAGSIVGDGTMSDGKIRGTAPGARLWAWFCQCSSDSGLYMPDSCEKLFRPDQTNYPTYIHSASWGSDAKGEYDEQCREFDKYVWENPDFLPVIAAGNSGSSAKTVNSPGVAKNVLAVGATQNLRNGSYSTTAGTIPSGDPTQIVAFSSRGPCQDGRIKPDVAAPGVGILSTRSSVADATTSYFGIGDNTNYAYNCGTSMATPLVAGSMALIREWLVERCGFTNVTPSAALMKAIVTGGAKGVETPNNDFGWGRVDVEETLFPSNRSVKLVDRLSFAAGRTLTYEVVVTNAAPLDVQLAWIDYPGTQGASQSEPQLVNNLDLTVAPMDESGVVYYGNGGTAADTVNTLESVRIAAAAPKRYLITVNCSDITYDHESGGSAALYVRGAFDAANGFVDNQQEVLLAVSMSAGGATPEMISPCVGVHKVLMGEVVTLSASEWAYEATSSGTTNARHRCLGYTLNGETHLVGATNLTLKITNDTTIAWSYCQDVTEYRFRVIAYPQDICDSWGWDIYEAIADNWYTNMYSFTVDIPSDIVWDWVSVSGYYPSSSRWPRLGTYNFRLGMAAYFATDAKSGSYLIDGSNGSILPSVTIIMDEGCDLWCYYYNESESTNDGLPYWWYVRYLWYGARYLQYDGSVSGDPDGDGFTNLAEYGDETNPVDDSSFRFKFDAFTLTNMTFTASIKGSLIVERNDAFGEEWTGVYTNSSVRTSVTNTMNLGKLTTSNGFYRVRYEPGN